MSLGSVFLVCYHNVLRGVVNSVRITALLGLMNIRDCSDYVVLLISNFGYVDFQFWFGDLWFASSFGSRVGFFFFLFFCVFELHGFSLLVSGQSF